MVRGACLPDTRTRTLQLLVYGFSDSSGCTRRPGFSAEEGAAALLLAWAVGVGVSQAVGTQGRS